jgi:hypothetical protein
MRYKTNLAIATPDCVSMIVPFTTKARAERFLVGRS